MLNVLAIDPGVTTGIAGANIDEDVIHVYVTERKMKEWQYFSYLQSAHADVIICEDFQYRNRARAGLELFSVRLIGITNLYVQLHETGEDGEEGCKLVMQTPATGLGGFFKNKSKLQQRHLYKPGCIHGMDAMRHLLYWLEFGGGYAYCGNKPYRLEHTPQ